MPYKSAMFTCSRYFLSCLQSNLIEVKKVKGIEDDLAAGVFIKVSYAEDTSVQNISAKSASAECVGKDTRLSGILC